MNYYDKIQVCPLCQGDLIIDNLGVESKTCKDNEHYIIFWAIYSQGFYEEKIETDCCFFTYKVDSDTTFFHYKQDRNIVNTMYEEDICGSKPGHHLFDAEFHDYAKNFLLLK